MAEINNVVAKASQDFKTIEDFVNLPAGSDVRPRLLPSVNVGTLAGTRDAIFEAGGLPAEPFATKALMTASPLVDGKYAMVTDDTANNGLYIKKMGAWIKSGYDPVKQATNYVDANPAFNPVLINSDININTLTKFGVYQASTSANVKTSLNYPKDGAVGVLSVKGSTGSSLVIQEYLLITGETYTRFYNGTTWSAWIERLSVAILNQVLTNYPLKSESLIFGAALANTDNLNDIKTIGMRMLSTNHANLVELNYPVKAIGVLETYKSPTSSIVFQRFITHKSVYTRTFIGTWSEWLEIATPDLTKGSYDVKAVLGTQDLNDLKTLGIYLKNSNAVVSPSLNYPTNQLGVLKVYAGKATSLIVQEYVADTGSVYVRFWNTVTWSVWTNKSSGGGDSTGVPFSKTASKLSFYTKTAGATNSIAYTLERQTRPADNLDMWGIRSCNEVDAGLSVVKPVTSVGVWEAAIKAAENVGDHSGGSHGDEVLQTAYFLVDGVYYAQDAALSGIASEIKFYQRSTIYIEAKTDVLCYKETTWTFTQDGINLKQKLTFPSAKVLNTAWVSMLPALRKVNQDNTGAQVTDTEIRSQDGVVVDVSEPLFAMRTLPIAADDSISLSSQTSGISTEVIINKIDASPVTQAFIQNSAPYNKIYISGINISEPYTTTVGEVWTNDTTFKVATRN